MMYLISALSLVYLVLLGSTDRAVYVRGVTYDTYTRTVYTGFKCPNDCNGRGTCDLESMCTCNSGYKGPDCSLRECPYDYAWVDKPNGLDKAHVHAECSNQGLCNYKYGFCECFLGYKGEACERTSCDITDCGEHGRCQTIQTMYSLYTSAGLASSSPNFTNWEGSKATMCVCDTGWTGPSCNMKMCPKGDDPFTSSNGYRTLQIRTQSSISPSSLSGYYRFFFNGYSFLFAADLNELSPSDCKAAFEGMLTLGSVSCENIAVTSGGMNVTVKFLSFPTIPVENNVYTNDGTASSGFYFCDTSLVTGGEVTCEVTDVTSSSATLKEYAYCSNRGVCDFNVGDCTCFKNFGNINCDTYATNIDKTYSNETDLFTIRATNRNYNSSSLLMLGLTWDDGLQEYDDNNYVGSKMTQIKFLQLRSNSNKSPLRKTYHDYKFSLYRNGYINKTGDWTLSQSNGRGMDVGKHVIVKGGSLAIYSTGLNSKVAVNLTGGGSVRSGVSVTGGFTVVNGVNLYGESTIYKSLIFKAGGSGGGVSVLGGGMTVKTGGLLVQTNGVAIVGGLLVYKHGVTINMGGLKVSGGMTIYGSAYYGGGINAPSGLTIYSGGLLVTSGLSSMYGGVYTKDGISVTSGLAVSGGITVFSGGLASNSSIITYKSNNDILGINGSIVVYNSGLSVNGGLSVYKDTFHISNTGLNLYSGLTVSSSGLNILGGITLQGDLYVTGGVSVESGGFKFTAGGALNPLAFDVGDGLLVIGGLTIGNDVGAVLSNGLSVYSGGLKCNDMVQVDSGVTAFGGVLADELTITGGVTINTAGLKMLAGDLNVYGGAFISYGMTVHASGLTVVNDGYFTGEGVTVSSDGLSYIGNRTSSLTIMATNNDVYIGGTGVNILSNVEFAHALMVTQLSETKSVSVTGAATVKELNTDSSLVYTSYNGSAVTIKTTNSYTDFSSVPIKFEGGLYVGKGSITISNMGIMVTTNGLTVSDGGLILMNNDLTVTQGGATVVGGISVNGALNVADGGMSISSGLYISGGGETVGAGLVVQNDGLTITNNGLTIVDGGLRVGRPVRSSGSLYLYGQAEVLTNGVKITGGLSMAGGVTDSVSSGNISNSLWIRGDSQFNGNVYFGSSAHIGTTGMTVTTTCKVLDMGLSAGAGHFTNSLTQSHGLTVYSGGIRITGGLTLNTRGLYVSSGGGSVSGGLSMTEGLTVYSGGLYANGSLSVASGGLISPESVTVYGGGSIYDGVEIQSGGLAVGGDGEIMGNIYANLTTFADTVNNNATVHGTATIGSIKTKTFSRGVYIVGGLNIDESITAGDSSLHFDGSGVTISSSGLIIDSGGMTIGGSFFYSGTLNYGDPTPTPTDTPTNAPISASDRRLKMNIVEVPKSLDLIRRIKGVYYNWMKDSGFEGEYTSNTAGHGRIDSIRIGDEARARKVGLLAQDVQNSLPEVVYNLLPLKVNTGSGSVMAVNYEEVVPVLINALNDLNERSKATTSRLNRIDINSNEGEVSTNSALTDFIKTLSRRVGQLEVDMDSLDSLHFIDN